MQRTLDLHYDELIIGADLSALCYSYINSIPIVYLRHLKPNPFHKISGKDATDKWNELMFLLSFNNLSPFADNVQSIRIADDNKLKIITNQNFDCNVSFNKLWISDDYKINGLGISTEKTDNNNLVIDWFKVFSGRKHEYETLLSDDKFVNKLEFYNSFRFRYFPQYKDVISYSYLTDEQLASSSYSQSIVRIKILRMMKEAKIKPDKNKRLKIQHDRREIFSLGKNIYKDLPESIKILSQTPEDILNNIKKENKYLDYIERILGGKRINR